MSDLRLSIQPLFILSIKQSYNSWLTTGHFKEKFLWLIYEYPFSFCEKLILAKIQMIKSEKFPSTAWNLQSYGMLTSFKLPNLSHLFFEWSLYSTTKRFIVVITTVPILYLWGILDWHNRAINWRVYWHMRFLLPFITQVACIASTTNESPFCVCFFIISLCTWNNPFCHYNMIKELLILNNYTFSYENILLCSIIFSYIG